jgi:hypothetical protein
LEQHRDATGLVYRKGQPLCSACAHRLCASAQIVPGSAHMREDLAIFEFELTNAERAALDALF